MAGGESIQAVFAIIVTVLHTTITQGRTAISQPLPGTAAKPTDNDSPVASQHTHIHHTSSDWAHRLTTRLRQSGQTTSLQATAQPVIFGGALPLLPLFNPLNPNSWIQGVLQGISKGLSSVLGTIFVGAVKQFLIISPIYHQGGANATFMQNLGYSIVLFPAMIVLGLIAALFSESDNASYMRQGIRFVLALFALALIRPFLHVSVVMTNSVTKLVMPQQYAISLAGPALHHAIGDMFASGLAAILVYLAAGAISLLAIALVVMILFLRIFMVHFVYTSFPILLVMWYADWGPLRYANDAAMFIFKITAYLLLAGPLVALALQAGCGMSAPGICTAHAAGAHSAQALTKGINPAQNKLVLWKRFLGWLTGLGMAAFAGIQALSMGGSSAGHLMGFSGLSMLGGGGGSTGAGAGGGGVGSSGGGGSGGAGTGTGGSGGPQHTLTSFGGGTGGGPEKLTGSGDPKPEFNPHKAAASAKEGLSSKISNARSTATGHARRAHRGIKSTSSWAQDASWKEGAADVASAGAGVGAIALREGKTGASHVLQNPDEPMVNYPRHVANRARKGTYSSRSSTTAPTTEAGAAAGESDEGTNAGTQASENSQTDITDADPEAADAVTGGIMTKEEFQKLKDAGNLSDRDMRGANPYVDTQFKEMQKAGLENETDDGNSDESDSSSDEPEIDTDADDSQIVDAVNGYVERHRRDSE